MALRLLRGCFWFNLSTTLSLVGFPLFVCLLSRIVFKFCDISRLVFAGRVCLWVAIIPAIMSSFDVCVFACIIFVAPSLVSQLLFPYVCVWTCSSFAWIQRLESASHPHLLTVVRSASSLQKMERFGIQGLAFVVFNCPPIVDLCRKRSFCASIRLQNS